MSIGTLPIKAKQKRLDFAFKLQTNTSKDFAEIEGEISSLLSNGSLTNIELAHELSFRAIWARLKNLEGQGKIIGKKIPGNHGAHVYSLL